MLSCVEHKKSFITKRTVISLIVSGKEDADYRKFNQSVIWPFNSNSESLPNTLYLGLSLILVKNRLDTWYSKTLTLKKTENWFSRPINA